ncbi:MAG: GAP family protein [Microcystis panniformis WG22]|nr:GAP family protein [Microcystis panniformis WG22]
MLTLTILWLAFIDSINPTPIAIAILIFLYRGTGGVWAYVYGIFLTTLVQSFVFYFGLSGLQEIISRQHLSSVNWGWLLILVGGMVSAYGLYRWCHRKEIPNLRRWDSLPPLDYANRLKFLAFGSATTLAETPGAFLLILAIIEIRKLATPFVFLPFYLGLYATIYTLPIIALNFAAIWQERRLKIWLSRRKNWIYIRLNILLSLSLLALGVFCLALGLGQL